MDPGTIKEATKRSLDNIHSPTNTPLRRDADLINIEGQKAFCRWLGLDWGEWRPTSQTPGYDFLINTKTVKVYACSPGGNMLIKQRTGTGQYAAYYVLAYVRLDPVRVRLRGWAEGGFVRSCHVEVMKRDGPYEQRAHYVPVSVLYDDMDELRRRLEVPGQLALL
jgi:hypothetical protein